MMKQTENEREKEILPCLWHILQIQTSKLSWEVQYSWYGICLFYENSVCHNVDLLIQAVLLLQPVDKAPESKKCPNAHVSKAWKCRKWSTVDENIVPSWQLNTFFIYGYCAQTAPQRIVCVFGAVKSADTELQICILLLSLWSKVSLLGLRIFLIWASAIFACFVDFCQTRIIWSSITSKTNEIVKLKPLNSQVKWSSPWWVRPDLHVWNW